MDVWADTDLDGVCAASPLITDSSEIAQAFQQLLKEWNQFQTLLPKEQQGVSGKAQY